MMKLEKMSDEGLMQLVSAREAEAFQALYDRYAGRVFAFLRRHCGDSGLAEDLLQETFWRVWLSARTFDPSRGDFCRWIYRVALNVSRNEMFRRRNRRECGLEPFEGESRGNVPPAGLETGLARALEKLTPAMREVVVLRCMEGWKFNEIESATGTSTGTLKARFHRAIKELRRLLSWEENR